MLKSAGVQFKILAPVIGSVALSLAIGVALFDRNVRQLREIALPEERNLTTLHATAMLLLNQYREYSLAPSEDSLRRIASLHQKLATYRDNAEQIPHRHDTHSIEAVSAAVVDLQGRGKQIVRLRERVGVLIEELEDIDTALTESLQKAQKAVLEEANAHVASAASTVIWGDTVSELSATTSLLGEIHRYLSKLKESVLGSQGSTDRQLAAAHAAMQQHLAQFAESAVDYPKEKPFVDELQRSVDSLTTAGAELLAVNVAYRGQLKRLNASESILTKVLADTSRIHGEITDAAIAKAFVGAMVAFITALCVIALITWISLRPMRASLHALRQASRRIGDGELAVRTVPKSNDEIGQLGHAFNEMAEKLERETQHREQLQDDLIRQERLAAIGELTAIVSHELRNPLGTVGASIFTIAERTRGRGLRVEQALERAERNVRRCDRIIEELLDLTRERKLLLDQVSIDNWLNQVLDEHDIPDNVALQRNIASRVLLVIDRERLRQAVVNIVDNAVQACVSGADDAKYEILVTAECEKERVHITFHDSGPGIPEELLHKVSNPMFTTKAFGVGLGLPIAKKAVEDHNGGLEIHNSNGEGARIAIWLPLTESATEQRP
jgi:signal transduction histidine kinase